MDEALKVATDALALGVNRLWGDRTHADLTIECYPRQWKVHKAILCSSSDFFKAACQPGRFKEGRDNVITLRSQSEVPGLPKAAPSEYDNPEAINVLIYHLYHPNIDYTTLAGAADVRLFLHAWVFAAAEKYNLKGLKLQAEHHIRALLKKAPNGGDVQNQIAEAMAAIFTGTAETVLELRRCMSSALLQNKGELLKVSAIQDAIGDIDGLAYALLRKATKMVGTGGLPECGARGSTRLSTCGSTSKHLMRLWRDKTHADLTVQCYPRQWRVHKAILYSRCGFFKAACEPGRFKEGSENIITLRARLESEDDDDNDDGAEGCDDPEAINVLLYYLYHPSTKYRDVDTRGNTLVLHARVFAAAEKYGLKELQTQSLGFAHEMMSQRDPDGELLDQISEALKPIYTETPETAISLRRSMNSVLWRNNGELLQLPLVRAAVENIPGLAYDLLLTKATRDFDKTVPPTAERGGSCVEGMSEGGAQGTMFATGATRAKRRGFFMHGIRQLSHDPSEKGAAVDGSRLVRRRKDKASSYVGETS
ncbi:hypothetical protein KC345_g3341 [Hortaea werneckii]|nr:hypothetical protein KC345_g3341 [Hortaea werneckii]